MLRIAWMIIVAALLPAGCQKPAEMEPFQPPDITDYNKPLPPGALALRKIPPERYPDFGPGFLDRAGLETAIQHSLDYLSKPSSQKYFPYGDITTHARAVATLHEMRRVLREARTADEFDRMIRRRFDVYESVGCDDRGTVYFTGYYTPIFEGRKQRDSAFRYPLYGYPPDLVKDEEGNILGRRTAGGELVPYYTRREIEEGQLLSGNEIAWLRTPFEAYVITVQGSAKLRLADGTLWELGYAGNNGHEYVPIAHKMLEDGVLRRDEISLQKMIAHFNAHPEQVYHYTWQNPRYVFFKEAPGGPYGSIGVPVTPLRSLATDKSVFPRACLTFATTVTPRVVNGTLRNVRYQAFALDQDTGGAIRAAGRCDIFMGIGDEAEGAAGRTGAEGHLYYLFVKPEYSGGVTASTD